MYRTNRFDVIEDWTVKNIVITSFLNKKINSIWNYESEMLIALMCYTHIYILGSLRQPNFAFSSTRIAVNFFRIQCETIFVSFRLQHPQMFLKINSIYFRHGIFIIVVVRLYVIPFSPNIQIIRFIWFICLLVTHIINSQYNYCEMHRFRFSLSFVFSLFSNIVPSSTDFI